MSSKRNFCLTSCFYTLLHGAASPSATFTRAILPAVRASWHYTPGAIQQRFIMVHKHTRPGRRKASTSFYFCPHVKSVKEGQPLLFGLTPLTGITFFVTRTNSCVWCSRRRWWLERRVMETIHYAQAGMVVASSGGQQRAFISVQNYPRVNFVQWLHPGTSTPFGEDHFPPLTFYTLFPNL